MNHLIKEVNIAEDIGCTYNISSIKTLPLHMHHAYEVVFVLKGNINLSCTAFSYHLSEGDIFIVNVNEMHSITSSNTTENLILTFHFNPYTYSNVFPNLSYYWFFCDSYSSDEKSDFNLKHFQSMLFNISYLLKEYNDGKATAHQRVKTLAADIISLMISNYQNISFYDKYSIKKNLKNGDALATKRIFEIQEYIYLNYTEKISLEDISSHLYLNKYYVSRLIKSFLGLNLTDLIGLIRTEKAEIKLLTTNSSIEQVAFECGFSSVAYFEKHFIKWNKLKPYEYRKNKLAEISESIESVIFFDIHDTCVQSAEKKLLHTQLNRKSCSNDHYISLDLDSEGSPFPHTWEKYINISDITTALPLQNKISLTNCKRELNFETARIINIFESFSGISSNNVFFENEIVSFLNWLEKHRLNIEFYIMPSAEYSNDLFKALTSFLNLALYSYEDLNNLNWSFVINTFFLKNPSDITFFENKTYTLLRKYNIDNIITQSHKFDAELSTYDSMYLTPKLFSILTSPNESFAQIGYRELLDNPVKTIGASISSAKNGLFGPFGEKKSIYYAWNLLSQLGNYLIGLKDGLIATKRGDNYYILLFDSESIAMPSDNMFSANMQFSISFKSERKLTYNLIELSLDSDKSLFKVLNELRFPKELTKRDVKLLNSYTEPDISMSYFSLSENDTLKFSLKPYSAKLIILEERKSK